jgi:hypothetical protein
MNRAPLPERLPQRPAPAGRLFLLGGALSGLLSAALGVAGGLLEGALGQAAQITLTLPSRARIPPDIAAAVADLCLVPLNLANLPAGVMFLAIALLSLRLLAFPR